LLPVSGTDDRYKWAGFVPLNQLPRAFNPAEGWFATANNRTIPADYKYKVGFEWATYRVERIRQVLGGFVAKQHKIRTEDAEELQNDVYCLPADELIRMLPRHSDGPEARFLDMLKDWDRVLRSPSVAGALYEVWERHLRTALVQKIAGVSTSEFAGYLNLQHAVDYLKSLPASDQQQLLLSSLVDAGHEMEQKEGADPALWSWGAMHTITFRHSLDQSPQGKSVFDLGPLARPGDGDTVDATGGDADFRQVSGASYREIFDLSNWDNSLAINTPGQSGQPASRHYSDLLPLWEAGQYFPLVYSKEAVEENAADVLTLLPEAAIAESNKR
jgi:penicillin amidase